MTATGDVDRPPSVDVYGAVLGTGSDAADLFDQLVAGEGRDPISSSLEHLSFPETRRFWAQLGDGDRAGDEDAGPLEPVYLFARSEFFRRPLPADAIAALMDAFARDRVPGESRELDFMPWSGAYNRVAPDATAFVHRTELFQLKHAIVVPPARTDSAIVGNGAFLGFRPRVPERRRPGTEELGGRLLWFEPGSFGSREETIRPGERLPLPAADMVTLRRPVARLASGLPARPDRYPGEVRFGWIIDEWAMQDVWIGYRYDSTIHTLTCFEG